MEGKTGLFAPEFLRKLEALSLATRQSLPGSSAGPRRAPRLGASVEFSDFRSYTPGDDYRRIDWNAYARLERLFLRLYRAEENLNVTLLLDTSRSMAWGQPPKIRLARQIAGALAYIGLARDDRVGAGALGEDLASYLAPVGSRAQVQRVWEFLEALSCQGSTDLGTALASLRRLRPRPGLAVVLTDLLTDSDWRAGLRTLLSLRQEVVLLQILAPDEMEPGLAGDWQLVDDEDGRPLEVTLTPRAVSVYRDRLHSYLREAAAFCHGHGITFLQFSGDVSVEDAVLRLLRRAQVTV
ncbi:MAG: DUF58 domain-containing protein [Chloroflexi bacterium]|nr:DUF58 domain-containing protein [Chloroflexota bacterium]